MKFLVLQTNWRVTYLNLVQATGGHQGVGGLLVESRLLLMGSRLGKTTEMPQLAQFYLCQQMSENKVLLKLNKVEQATAFSFRVLAHTLIGPVVLVSSTPGAVHFYCRTWRRLIRIDQSQLRILEVARHALLRH